MSITDCYDLLNSFDRLTRTTSLLCQVSGHSDQEFSFYRANIHTHTPTHIHTHRDRVIGISALTTYYADNKSAVLFTPPPHKVVH